MRRVAFDVDGTLVDGVHRFQSIQDVAAGVGHETACRRTRNLIDDGWEVHFVTARGRHLEAVTLQQLRLDVHLAVDQAHVHHQSTWMGHAAAVNYKAAVLRNLQPAWFCGDGVMDRDAAAAAGVPFVPAETWRLNRPVEVLV